MLTEQSIPLKNNIPLCRWIIKFFYDNYIMTKKFYISYDILSDGPNGSSVRYAKVGDLVYHKWTCDTKITNMYCMRVHTCTVNDGQNGQPIYVIDENG